MPISETVTYIIVFGLTLIFSIFALTLKENRLFLKSCASLCWYILAIITQIFNTAMAAVPIALTFLFGGFGTIFVISTVSDWFGEKKGRFEQAVSE